MALSDRRIAELAGLSPTEVADARRRLALTPTFKCVDTCAAEFAAATPYYYSTVESEDERPAPDGDAVVVLGSGPIRIGQGIEFDYCSVQAAEALRLQGVAAIMVNSNPETVSTDFDCSTRLYFEPLDQEAVLAVIEAERASGVVVQFGGQTAINLAEPLDRHGVRILGTTVDAIDLAEDRRRFEALMRRLEIPQPHGAATIDPAEAAAIADRIGYPVLVRPSFVLGGRAMEVVHSRDQLQRFVAAAMAALPEDGDRVGGSRGTVLVDKYLFGTEIDVDAVSDGETVVIPGLMEHVERAGVHSGDSMAAYPAPGLDAEVTRRIVADTVAIARALPVRGLCNIQFVIWRGLPHVLEVNPRASRTVPVHQQGHRGADGRAGHPGDARRAARRPRLRDRAAPAAPTGRGQGPGVLDRQARPRQLGARAGDEVHRRGDGHRHDARGRGREGVRGRARRGAHQGSRALQHRRRRQGGGAADHGPALGARVRDLRHRRDRGGPERRRGQRHRGGEDRAEPAQRPGHHRGGPGLAGRQHRLQPGERRAEHLPLPGGRAGRRRAHGQGRLPHPARRRAPPHPCCTSIDTAQALVDAITRQRRGAEITVATVRAYRAGGVAAVAG